eukprot:1412264-Rhodomonas_salina.3
MGSESLSLSQSLSQSESFVVRVCLGECHGRDLPVSEALLFAGICQWEYPSLAATTSENDSDAQVESVFHTETGCDAS